MEWRVQSTIDGITRALVREYEGQLARAGLRARYDGVMVREDVPGMRESEVQLWFYRGRDLVDQIEVPIERPGLEPVSPEDLRQRLGAALRELTTLHVGALREGASRQLAAPPPWPVYARRLQALAMQVLIVPAAALAGVALVGGGAAHPASDVIVRSLVALVGTYVAALPTAAIASLLHTHLVRAIGRETERLSTLLGVAIGVVAGASTPWFVPLIAPLWPAPLVAAFAVLGGVMGGAYGALVTRRHPICRTGARGESGAETPRRLWLSGGVAEGGADGAGQPDSDPATRRSASNEEV